MSNKKRGGFFTGIVLGSLLGGAYGLLFAQKKGITLRKEIQETAKKGGNIYKVFAKELSLSGKESMVILRELFESEHFQSFVKTSQVKLEDLKKLAYEKGEAARQELQEKIDYLSDLAKEKSDDLQKKAKKTKETMVKKGQKKLVKAKKSIADFTKKMIP